MSNEEMEDIKKRLEAIEKAVNELHKSVKELSDYVKGEAVKEATEYPKALEKVDTAQATEKADTAPKAAEKIDTVEDAMDIAHSFMKKDNPVALPLKAHQREDIWVVDVDIGAVRMEIVRVKIDANTGEILGHETVEKK
jgi:mannose-6-phosphate isomerase-like protein (cupin superfamily)